MHIKVHRQTFQPFYPPSIFSLILSPIQNRKLWICPLECTVSYISQKLCVFQPSSPLYSIHPLRLSHWPARLYRPVRQGYAGVNYSISPRTMNLATVQCAYSPMQYMLKTVEMELVICIVVALPLPPFIHTFFCKYIGKCSPRSPVTFRSKGSDKSLKV